MNEADYTEWVKFAEADLQSAHSHMKCGDFPAHIIFHCHDALEKFLKAIMLKNSVNFQYIHKLRSLVDDAPITVQDKSYLDNTFNILDALYLYCRYPDMGKPPGKEEAKAALERTLESAKILKKYL